MNMTAKAAVLALVALMAFQSSVTSSYADDRKGNQVEDAGHNDNDDVGRKKPKFQTKFFSEE
jgi:hypothetical protein